MSRAAWRGGCDTVALSTRSCRSLLTILALVVGAVLLTILGVNPLTAYGSLLRGAFGTVSGFTQTLTTPLLLVVLGICIAFRGGVINIGGEGQIIIGAVVAVAVALALPTLPGVLLVPLTLGAGVAGGGRVGRHRRRAQGPFFWVNEIFSTVMLNAIAWQLIRSFAALPHA